MADMTKQKENLIAIREWCKSVSVDNPIMIKDAVFCNNRYYRLSISKVYGIGACGDGKYSNWMHAVDGDYSLFGSVVGSEIIYNWGAIKQRILNAIDDYNRKQDIMNNFVV